MPRRRLELTRATDRWESATNAGHTSVALGAYPRIYQRLDAECSPRELVRPGYSARARSVRRIRRVRVTKEGKLRPVFLSLQPLDRLGAGPQVYL